MGNVEAAGGELAVTYRRVADLRTYHRNPRRGNTGAIAESLRVNGQYRPIVVNVGTFTGRADEVLAGNHTLIAARDLGWEQVATVSRDVDDDQAARIVAADNRTADLADYDQQVLAELLSDLDGLEGTGYTDKDLAELMAADDGPVSLNDPDDVPSRPATPVSRLGDLWLLGPHRLVCGSAINRADVERALDGKPAGMLFTDPPYGVAYQGGTADKLVIANDDVSAAELGELLDDAFAVAHEQLAPGAPFYVCAPSGVLETTFRLSLASAGLGLRQQIVWVKDRFVLGRADYHGQHETLLYGWRFGEEPPVPPHFDPEHDTVLYGWKEGAAHTWEGGRKQSTVWAYDRPSRSAEHPTMKPVPLVKRAVQNSSSPDGGRVLDFFAGSGSTLIACHLAGRVASLVELEPRYADVICRRYQEHTGTTPVRDGVEHDFTEAAGG